MTNEMKKDKHRLCLYLILQDCQSSLSDEQTIGVLGGCCPLADGTLLCYRCRMRRGLNEK